ncbi:5'-methylthioadenosine/adenosylhomocysteine nucleosidase [Flavobacterium sp. 3HN19-14]|uniref:5'-methylthioadenosine/adenosylhomocysteine nucleosidase n=1 Tax=Flavobacterium sp. 3HN19-14 TaxID=3448133 RepID=UPI003EE342F3
MKNRVIGIMGAMPEEIDGVANLLSESTHKILGKRKFISGKLNGIDTVVVFSRWGKTAAAATVATLISEYKITELFFTGVAGAIHPDLKIGDIVIGTKLIQHDMDARPLMAQYEIPLIGKTFFQADELQTSMAEKAVNKVLENKVLHEIISDESLKEFNIKNPKLHIGTIASGDQFFANESRKHDLILRIPSVLCVEMEGAAVAQVCYEYDLPFAIIRTISDTADESSHIDFPSFINEVSSKYSTAIIKNIFDLYRKTE